MTKKEDGTSQGGSRIYRYSEPPRPGELVAGEPENIAAISDHIERHVGPVETVFHEIVSPTVHVDIHHVPPARNRPFHTLVTSGMSDLRMTTPEGAEDFGFAELVVLLPNEWPVTQADFNDERNYWPVRQMKMLARFPHDFGTWLGPHHTVPNGDPPAPYAEGTGLCGMILLGGSISLPREFSTLELPDGRTIRFLTLMPLYAEEMSLKLDRGPDALFDRLGNGGISDVIDVARPNVCAKRRWFPFF